MEEEYLSKYTILGLQRNYTSAAIFEQLNAHKDQIRASFEDFIYGKTSLESSLEAIRKFIVNDTFGVELDLDSIASMGSSAQTPSGFTLEEARYFVKFFASRKHVAYFHFCEGAPAFEAFPNQVGKALAFLVSDVISK